MPSVVVENIGYLKKEQVADMISNKIRFGIYKTHKDTVVLVIGADYDTINLYYPKKDRLPWKTVNGKKIAKGNLIFNPAKDDFKSHDFSKWNNNTQIITYKEFSIIC